MIKSLPLLTLKALTLKNLILENYSPPLSPISKNLLITILLTPAPVYYIASFTIRTAIIIIKALHLKSITTRKKITNTIIIIKCFKYKKIKII